jgi:integral membrane protein (TIGR01906 family)
MVLMNRLATPARAVLLLAVPVIMLSMPLYVFVTPGFVRYEYGLRGFPPSTHFDTAERLRLSDTILHYLRGRASLEAMATMATAQGEVALRDSETQHLVDVKVVTDGFFIAHGGAVVAAALSLLILGFSSRRSLIPAALRQGVFITGGVILLLVMASFINFDVFFTRFHEVFFRADSWLFYEDDTLIQLYPLRLWQDAVWKIGAMVLLELGAVYGVSLALDRWPWMRAVSS